MKTHQRLFLFIVLLLMVGIIIGQNISYADPIESDTSTILRLPSTVGNINNEASNSGSITRVPVSAIPSPEDHPRYREASNLTGMHVSQIPEARIPTNSLTPTELQRHQLSAPAEEVCWQLLGNSTMDIFPIDDNTATVEPWVPMVQQVYYDDRSGYFLSPPTSLALAIDDDGDTDYEYMIVEDAFAQAFFMPGDLTEIYIEYNVSLLNQNDSDSAYFDLWTVDADGYLLDQIDFWRIDDLNPPEPPNWQTQYLSIDDPTFLNDIEGKVLALVFDNYTAEDNLPGSEETREIVWFDDAVIIACANAPESNGIAFMPLIMKNVTGISNPICLPPTEIPQDSFTQHRGTVQTSALCETTLSSVDRQDYYSFRTGSAGSYRLSITNLPANTEWSGSILIENPPAYAPGPSDNTCRITTPGSVNKEVTCNLAANKEYIVKISAGDYDGPIGSYKMRVTKP